MVSSPVAVAATSTWPLRRSVAQRVVEKVAQHLREAQRVYPHGGQTGRDIERSAPPPSRRIGRLRRTRWWRSLCGGRPTAVRSRRGPPRLGRVRRSPRRSGPVGWSDRGASQPSRDQGFSPRPRRPRCRPRAPRPGVRISWARSPKSWRRVVSTDSSRSAIRLNACAQVGEILPEAQGRDADVIAAVGHGGGGRGRPRRLSAAGGG